MLSRRQERDGAVRVASRAARVASLGAAISAPVIPHGESDEQSRSEALAHALAEPEQRIDLRRDGRNGTDQGAPIAVTVAAGPPCAAVGAADARLLALATKETRPGELACPSSALTVWEEVRSHRPWRYGSLFHALLLTSGWLRHSLQHRHGVRFCLDEPTPEAPLAPEAADAVLAPPFAHLGRQVGWSYVHFAVAYSEELGWPAEEPRTHRRVRELHDVFVASAMAPRSGVSAGIVHPNRGGGASEDERFRRQELTKAVGERWDAKQRRQLEEWAALEFVESG